MRYFLGDLVRTRLNVCIKKLSFQSEGEAIAFAGHSGRDLRPYRCDRCRLFHLTSRTKGKRIPRPQG